MLADPRLAARRLLATPLFTLFAVPVPLIVAASCAGSFPAQRAAAVDPNVALRPQSRGSGRSVGVDPERAAACMEATACRFRLPGTNARDP